MVRSRLRENQVQDADFLSESEHIAIGHYFRDLLDAPTISGHGGKHLRVKSDGTILEFDTWGELSGSTPYSPPSGTLNINFSGGYSPPAYNEIDFIFDIIYYVANGDRVFINSTDSGFIVVLPPDPSMGDFVSFMDGPGYCGTNAVTISGSGEKIMGLAENMDIDVDHSAFDLVYYNSSKGWIIK